jgi:hypothetical protein
MKRFIIINQFAAVKVFPQLLQEEKPKRAEVPDLVDLALFDYIRSKCIFGPKVRPIGLGGEEYAWLDYEELLEEMPLLGIRDKGSLSRRIKKLRELGLIETLLQKGLALYVKLTPKGDRLATVRPWEE